MREKSHKRQQQSSTSFFLTIKIIFSIFFFCCFLISPVQKEEKLVREKRVKLKITISRNFHRKIVKIVVGKSGKTKGNYEWGFFLRVFGHFSSIFVLQDLILFQKRKTLQKFNKKCLKTLKILYTSSPMRVSLLKSRF